MTESNVNAGPNMNEGPNEQHGTPPHHPVIEAILLMATEPVPASAIAEALDEPASEIEGAMTELADFYDRSGRGFALRHSGGGWRLQTRPEHAEALGEWVVSGQNAKLSRAAMETLAVVAYLQPVTRTRVSAVRGVKVDAVMRTLESRGLVEPVESDQPGQAYGTTSLFLERLGIDSLDELPDLAPHLPDALDLEAELARLDPVHENVSDGPDAETTDVVDTAEALDGAEAFEGEGADGE